jgi:hypothetical protein
VQLGFRQCERIDHRGGPASLAHWIGLTPVNLSASLFQVLADRARDHLDPWPADPDGHGLAAMPGPVAHPQAEVTM